MKLEVVINTCYGGFSLSDEAVELYTKITGETPDKYYIERHDPALVEVVKSLGSRANGLHAKLQVVELTFEYDIDYYDGKETVSGGAVTQKYWRGE